MTAFADIEMSPELERALIIEFKLELTNLFGQYRNKIPRAKAIDTLLAVTAKIARDKEWT